MTTDPSPSSRITQQQIESYLWARPPLLRGFIDAGNCEVKQALRKTLFKYKLHQEQAPFDRAYEYIRQYYKQYSRWVYL